MASKKTTPTLEIEENLTEQSTAATSSSSAAEAAPKAEGPAVPNPDIEKILKQQQEQIRQLQEQLAKAQTARPQKRRGDAEMVKAAAEAAAAEGRDPWQEIVSVRVPRRPRTEDPYYWIAVNGRTVQIPADDTVQDLKLPFAEVLYNILQAEKDTEDYIDSLEIKDPVSNPKG